jgi:hypothetical protein
VSNLIGSETSTAIRVRKHREKIKALPCNTGVTLMKQNDNGEIEKEIEIEIEKEIEDKPHNKRKAFSKPTLPDVIEYMIEKGGIEKDGDKFYAYYESVGWCVGKKKMVSWKAAASGWILRESEHRKQAGDQPRSYAEYKKMMGISQ